MFHVKIHILCEPFCIRLLVIHFCSLVHLRGNMLVGPLHLCSLRFLGAVEVEEIPKQTKFLLDLGTNLQLPEENTYMQILG